MYRKGGRATQPQPFSVFVSKQADKVGVRVGAKRAYTSVVAVTISPTAMPLRVVRRGDGLLMQGEGVVRQVDDVAIITA